jgi:TRAP-type mannitol/chloroaromatic compound transport system permease small subunit
MPDVTFVLPHWLYWSGLVVFPLIAMYLSRQVQPTPGSRSLTIAYFIWLVGGMFGFHRLYLKSKWGFLYWPLFALILYASGIEREARVAYSDAVAAVDAIGSSTARNEKRIAKSVAAIAKAETALAQLPEDDERARKRQLRKIEKDQTRISKSKAAIADMSGEVAALEPLVKQATERRETWSNIAFYAFLAIVAFLAVDGILMKRLLAKARAFLKDNPDDDVDREVLKDDRKLAGTGFVGMIDRLSLFSGEFVAFWSVIAVFVYYYEVMVRYVFNSPTNWAHEGMFLMFGMQYLIAGAYAMLSESHVRVDIFYANFSPRGKATVDLLTSVFFFIFAFTLLWTGLIFASDAIGQREVSFTEWAIQYWPVKIAIVVGAVLLILQGVSKVVKDAALVFSPNKELTNGS